MATAGAGALALTLAVTACGGSPARPAAPSGVLPTAAVAGLAVATQPLTSQDVQKDSNAPDLAARLAGWGYVSGWQRTFQGESRRLTLVVSRSLQFRTSPGAAAFVAYMHQKVGSFYPFGRYQPAQYAGTVRLGHPAAAMRMPHGHPAARRRHRPGS
jgi:hypothetical protein